MTPAALCRHALADLIMLNADALDLAPSREEEERIVQRIFDYATQYMILVAREKTP